MESIDTADRNQNLKSPSPSRLVSGEFEGILETKLEHKLDLSKIDSLNKSIDKGETFHSSDQFDASANIKIELGSFTKMDKEQVDAEIENQVQEEEQERIH